MDTAYRYTSMTDTELAQAYVDAETALQQIKAEIGNRVSVS